MDITTIIAIVISLAVLYLTFQFYIYIHLYRRFSYLVQQGDLESARDAFRALVRLAPSSLVCNPTLYLATVDVALLELPLSRERLLSYFASLGKLAAVRRDSAFSDLLLAGITLQNAQNVFRYSGPDTADATSMATPNSDGDYQAHIKRAVPLCDNDWRASQLAGEICFKAHDLDQADNLLGNALKILSRSIVYRGRRAAIRTLLIESALDRGCPALAIERLKDYLDNEPCREYVFPATVVLAQEYRKTDRLSDAIALLKQVVECCNYTVPVTIFSLYIEYLLKSDQGEEARLCLMAACLHNPALATSSPFFGVEQARISIWRRNNEQALQTIDEVIKSAPSSGYFLLEAALLSLSLDRVPQAVTYLERADNQTPLPTAEELTNIRFLNDPCVKELLADTYVEIKRYDDAITAYRRLLKEWPQTPRLQIKLAQALDKVNPKEADKWWEKAAVLINSQLQSVPDQPALHHMKSLCEAHRGNWEEALLHSTVTVKAWPGEALGWYQLGNVSQQLGDTRLTEECYRNTLRHLDNRRGHLAKRVMARLEEILSTHQDQTANASPPPCNN